MKIKEHSRQVKDEVVERLTAESGFIATSYGALLNSSSEIFHVARLQTKTLST